MRQKARAKNQQATRHYSLLRKLGDALTLTLSQREREYVTHPLRKAVSAAYYAMFHALCRSNADTMTGRRTSPLSQSAWTRTYRALEHRQAKNRLLQTQQNLPAAAQRFAAAFALLQNRREAADYNPHLSLTRAEVAMLLNVAENTIVEYMQMPRNERRAIATLVLLQERNVP